MLGKIAVTVASGVFVAGLFLCSDAARAGSNDANCEGFDLTVDVPGTSKKCSEETVNNGRFTAEVKQIFVQGSDFFLNLVYAAAGHNMYFYEVPPRETFTSSWGQLNATEWGDTKTVGGYQTVTFKLQENSGALNCFAFEKFKGVPHGEFEGPPGYQTRAAGFYCAGAMSDPNTRADVIAKVLQGVHSPAD